MCIQTKSEAKPAKSQQNTYIQTKQKHTIVEIAQVKN
jgi:hypothetical protein